MSSVHAVTRDIMFVAKVASFTPINDKQLAEEFAAWVAQRGQEKNFLVWRAGIEIPRWEVEESK
jgi:hypothetical protein